MIIETDLDKIFEQKLNFLKSKKINLSKPTNIDDFIKQTNEIPLIIPKFEKTQEIDIDALLDSEISDVEENNLDLERIPKENTLKNTICNNLLKLEKNNFFEHKIFTKNGKTTFSASPEPFFQNSKSHFEDLEKEAKETCKDIIIQEAIKENPFLCNQRHKNEKKISSRKIFESVKNEDIQKNSKNKQFFFKKNFKIFNF